MQANQAATDGQSPPPLPSSVRFVLLTVFLDILGVGLIIPVLPSLVGAFGLNASDQAHWYGWVIAIYGVMQFFFAPLIGALSDRYGRRPVLLTCVAGLGLNFLAMPFAPGVLWLLVIRAVGGITAGNLSVANAYIADVSPPAQRS